MTILKTISNPQYLNLLQKCSTMDQLKQIHAQTITTGLARFTYIASKLLACSSKFDINHTHKIFAQKTIHTIFDYNTMMLSYSNTPRKNMGLFLYTQMCKNEVDPDEYTFPILIKTCACFVSVCQVHGQVFKYGNVSDVYVSSSLICMYSGYKVVNFAKRVFEECEYKNVVCCTSFITGCFGNGLVENARKVFEEMRERNDVTYSAMISGLVRNERFDEAIELFKEMEGIGVLKMNRLVLVSVLNACGVVGAFDVGRRVHCRLVDKSVGIDLELGTALIDFYAKCGEIEKAEDVFSKLRFKDVVTWSAMVLGLATNGKNEMALKLFKEMEEKGPVPNDITFVAVLVACNHETLVKEAWWLLGKMSKVYNVRPTIEHYGCMVDLLARSGQLKRAQILIKLMPMAPDGAIWGSFMHGCLTYNETRLGEKAGKHMLELEPQHSGRYVLLANMYGDMGSWEGVANLRNMMKRRKVVTAPGWSFIEVNGIVQKFFADGQCHPRVKDLREILKVLNKVSMT
uniref:pentatricopeptide repeat-containing protein At5g06540-like n=1 Tax=Erigeron canadensis TaxID=72917 RepID=UPI001CB9C7DA|nr:pentatricopeptide repeat-containing protein At5g06540-like [Erigeron canadensis]